MKSIHCARVNHINLVLQDFDASIDYARKVYGAEFVLDIPERDWHACLIEMGRVMFELFVPHELLLHARYGPHYLGIEYQADMAEVREAVAAHGIRIIRDVGIALHTHPADCLGSGSSSMTDPSMTANGRSLAAGSSRRSIGVTSTPSA